MNTFRQFFLNGKSRYVNFNHFRSAQQKLSKSEADAELLLKQDAQISQISSGVTVASIENYSPLSHVSVAIKAGSRFENSENSGISHCLRNCAVLSTKNATAFSLTTGLELIGAKLSVSGTREHLIYHLECGRDNIDTALKYLGEIISNPTFKPWEVDEASYRLKLDLAMLSKNPDAILMEALHKAAFRGGLSNSLFAQEFMIGRHSSEMLNAFVSDNFSPSRTSVFGLGLPHDDLQQAVNHFNLGGQAGSDGASKFSPGEVRIESDIPFVHVGIVAEGASSSNAKEALSFGVLQSLLGLGSHISTSGSQFSKLGEVVAKKISDPFHVSALNINYHGTGLFGVHIVGKPKDMTDLVKSVVGQMRSASKIVNDSSVEIAKHKLKANLLLSQETSKSAATTMVSNLASLGKVMDKAELEKSIDELKTSDVQSIAAKVVKAKPAMAAIGRLHKTPYLDELL